MESKEEGVHFSQQKEKETVTLKVRFAQFKQTVGPKEGVAGGSCLKWFNIILSIILLVRVKRALLDKISTIYFFLWVFCRFLVVASFHFTVTAVWIHLFSMDFLCLIQNGLSYVCTFTLYEMSLVGILLSFISGVVKFLRIMGNL